MTVSLSARDLHKALTQIAPHVSEEDLPVIASARLEAEGGNLFVVATDRYTMAVARIGTVETATWQANIPADDLPTVLAWLHSADTTTISVKAATPEVGTTRLALASGVSYLRIDTTDADYKSYPDWRKQVSQQLSEPAEPVSDSGLDATFLARWEQGERRLRFWQAGAHKPLIFMDDDATFIGLQMPVRWEKGAHSGLVGQWTRMFLPTVTVDGVVHRLDGRWVDTDGDEWEFTGRRNPGGEPLVTVVGIEGDDYTFDEAMAKYGPLKPAV